MKELLICTIMWMKHKCILLSKRSQIQLAEYYIISFIQHPGKGKITETEIRSVVSRNYSSKKGGLTKVAEIF